MNQKGLKTVLRANAGFSALSGLTLILAANALSELFGQVHPWIFRGVGIGLLLFAADILLTCRRAEVPRPKALYFSFGDLGWVAGSVLVLVLAPLPASAAGLVAAVALIVLGFGFLQIRHIRSPSTRTS